MRGIPLLVGILLNIGALSMVRACLDWCELFCGRDGLIEILQGVVATQGINRLQTPFSSASVLRFSLLLQSVILPR
jgi:hypothetical protein